MADNIKINEELTESINKAVAKIPVRTHAVKWQDIELNVIETLSLPDMLTFVNGVVKNCFSDETGEYIPETKDFLIRSYTLDVYAGITLPEDATNAYALVYNTDIFNTIYKYINTEQFDQMISAINTKIERIERLNTEHIYQQINDICNGAESLFTQLSGIFSDVDAEDITKLLGAISETGFDVGKLYKEYTQSNGSSEKSDNTES